MMKYISESIGNPLHALAPHPVGCNTVLDADILREIFILVADHRNGNGPTTRTKPPLKLTHVCWFWRQVALDTPELWTVLPIIQISCTYSNDGATEIRSSPSPNYIDYLLNLSTTRPLSIYINAPARRHVRGLLSHYRRVLEEFRRWENVTLNVDCIFFSWLSRDSARIFPTLKVLNLQGSITTVIDSFQYAPQLSNVTLYDRPGNFSEYPNLLLPWNQLKSYQERNISRNSVPWNECSNIVNLSLTAAFFFLIDMTPLSLNHLQSLDLRFASIRGQSGKMLSKFIFPSLQDLAIEIGRYSSWVILDDITELILRSRCNVHRLSIWSSQPSQVSSLSEDKLSQLLLATPNLLELDVFNVSEVDLESFNQHSGFMLVPKLQRLIIRQTPKMVPYVKKLADVIISRFQFHPTWQDSASCGRALSFAQLQFYEEKDCSESLMWLEGWEGLEDSEFKMLKTWRHHFFVSLHRLATEYKHTGKMGVLSRLEELFCELEGHTFLHAENIYVALNFYGLSSRIHKALFGNIPADTYKTILDRLHALKQKCKPILLADIESRNWAFDGRGSLTYIPLGCSERERYDDQSIVDGTDGSSTVPSFGDDPWISNPYIYSP